MKLNSRSLFLLLTFLTAAIYVWPELNFQDHLAQGDHGRDLYAFDAVTRGKLAYKDFWWVYGPLMPYYYGLFFKIFGVHISSVLLGRALLGIACSVFMYLSAVCLMPPGLAYLATVWFTQSRQEFFFTYNHIGGIAAELVICWCLLSYLRIGTIRYLWIAVITAFVLCLIKINFGLAALAGIALSVLWIDTSKKYRFDDQKKKIYLTAIVIIPLAVGFIYWILLKDLPLYAIRQCMPYFGDDQPYHASPLLVIPYYLTQHWLTLVRTRFGIPIGLVLHGCTLVSLYILIFKKIDRTYRQDILLGLAVIGIFFVAYFNEFIVSGVWYRTYWSMPFLSLFHFVMIAVAFTIFPKFLRILILIFLGAASLMGVVAHIGVIQSQKTPDRYLSMDRGKIYVGNETPWTDTVTKVNGFLTNGLRKDELFFALPYDCLYYYLSGKDSPTRQLIFFDHIKIPPQQEISVIRELEKNKVGYILMSNRFISPEVGLGIFGKTNCPLLGRYIHDNFTAIGRQGGDWTQPPGTAENHGVIILKKAISKALVHQNA